MGLPPRRRAVRAVAYAQVHLRRARRAVAYALAYLRRAVRAVAYALMCLAGIAAMAWPAPSVRAATAPTSGLLVYLWAGFLAAGGLLASLGAATDRWIGELTGLPLLAAVFAVYGLAAFASGRWPAVAGGLAFTSIAMILYARWRDVDQVRREAARQAEHDDGA